MNQYNKLEDEIVYLNQLVDEKEAANMLCYSVRALQNWRHRGGGPKFVKPSSRSVRYRIRDLHEWIESRTVSNTSQAIHELKSK
ncbi:DNA-binding protein [Rhodobacterales bacterium 52_120_T64]|nr:DNA-binding protein [Rhodobacterales bacterium 52_120_T64]